MFAGHIVIAIFADEDSPMLGLRYKGGKTELFRPGFSKTSARF